LGGYDDFPNLVDLGIRILGFVIFVKGNIVEKERKNVLIIHKVANFNLL